MVFQALKKKQEENRASINLDEVIHRCISNTKKLNLEKQITQNVEILTKPDELIKIMKLRSEIFSPISGFSEQFPDPIKGLNFDNFDKYSINFGYKREGRILGTIRIILDSNYNLQTENIYNSKFGFNRYRIEYKNHKNPICEISRIAIRPQTRGKGIWQELFKAKGQIIKSLDIGTTLASMACDHYHKYYEKLGMKVIKKIQVYGKIPIPCYITNWPTNQFSGHFKTEFLGEKI